MAHILKHRVGLPIWDGDSVVGIKDKFPGETITKEELHAAGQSAEEQEMLIEHNCYTAEELEELKAKKAEAEQQQAFVTSADEPLPTQEER